MTSIETTLDIAGDALIGCGALLFGGGWNVALLLEADTSTGAYLFGAAVLAATVGVAALFFADALEKTGEGSGSRTSQEVAGD